MIIVPQESKKLISVLGLPRSGTTIVCNIFNSMDNAFCLSEPHWTLITNPSALRLDKTNINFTTPESVIPQVLAKLKKDDSLKFAGIKETFRPQDRAMRKHINRLLHADIVVFVVREPKAHYNSFKVLSKSHNRNFMPLKNMINMFNALYDTIKKHKDKSSTIILEDLCDANNNKAISYMNSRANNMFAINGPFKLNKTNYIYGNPKANNSNKLAKANMATNLLLPDEIQILNKELLPKYNEIKALYK